MAIIFSSFESATLTFVQPYNLSPFALTDTLVPDFFAVTNAELLFTLVAPGGAQTINPNGNLATPPGPSTFQYISGIPLADLAMETQNAVAMTAGVPFAQASALLITILVDVFSGNPPNNNGVWTAIIHWDTSSILAGPLPQQISFTWGGLPTYTYLAIKDPFGPVVQPVSTVLAGIESDVTAIYNQTTGGTATLFDNASAARTSATTAASQTDPGGTLALNVAATTAAVTTEVSSPANLFYYVKTALENNLPVPAILPGPGPGPFGAPNMADQITLTYWMLSGLTRTFDTVTGRIYLDLEPLAPPPGTPVVYFQCWANAARTIPATNLAEVVVQDPWTIVVGP